jgi:hypothetical protein
MKQEAHKKVVTLTISPLILHLAKERCRNDGVSLSSKVEDMLWSYLASCRKPSTHSAPATSAKTT